MHYTGIGSRKTPAHIMDDIRAVAKELATAGYTLRSGKADGADKAFQQGAESFPNSTLEIYIPWKGFEKECGVVSDTHDIVPTFINDLCPDIASTFHPNWGYCSAGAKKLHSRNVCQVLGDDLKTPSDFVLFYAEEKNGKVKGGTAMAVSIARFYSIPTINMFDSDWRSKLDILIRKS